MMTPSTQHDAATTEQPGAPTIDPEQARRAGMYSILGALLRKAPEPAVLAFIAELETAEAEVETELSTALRMLALASRHSAENALRDEYHALFIGLGRGELVPYGSWYQTGFLMERPLGQLRGDLRQLGLQRVDDVKEPEDHVAALCEVMALLIQDDTPLDRQKRFFDTHVGNWAGAFFDDLAQAKSAVFYRSVARFGTAFLAVESRYLSLLD